MKRGRGRFLLFCITVLLYASPQWAGVAYVSVIIDDSVLQLFLLCGIEVIMFAILLQQKPFANR